MKRLRGLILHPVFYSGEGQRLCCCRILFSKVECFQNLEGQVEVVDSREGGSEMLLEFLNQIFGLLGEEE